MYTCTEKALSTQGAYTGLVKDLEQSLRHDLRSAKCATGEFADISEMLQPSSSGKIPWPHYRCPLLHSACAFATILVLQGV